MNNIGSFIIPSVVFLIIIWGYIKHVDVFDAFIIGAKNGIITLVSIVPSLIGLVVSISMLKASGAIDIITKSLEPICKSISVPKEVIPLIILKPISGSGSIAILNNILSEYGVDSFIGKIASVIMGSTETAFYTIAVYFGSIGIKRTRHTVISVVLADILGIFVAIWSVRIFFTANT